MENPQQDPFQFFKTSLPNSTAVFVLGLCSVIFACFFVGFILGIIGLFMAREPRAMYRDNPNLYEGYGLLNAGYVLSIIGVCLGALYIAYFVIIFLFFATRSM
jgi:hypothetical protein